jgi:hypothetical protein
MKTLFRFLFFSFTIFGVYSNAATKWSNCTTPAQSQEIQEAFWQSDIEHGTQSAIFLQLDKK